MKQWLLMPRTADQAQIAPRGSHGAAIQQARAACMNLFMTANERPGGMFRAMKGLYHIVIVDEIGLAVGASLAGPNRALASGGTCIVQGDQQQIGCNLPPSAQGLRAGSWIGQGCPFIMASKVPTKSPPVITDTLPNGFSIQNMADRTLYGIAEGVVAPRSEDHVMTDAITSAASDSGEDNEEVPLPSMIESSVAPPSPEAEAAVMSPGVSGMTL